MSQVKHLDIEVSSTCQAACPVCARNSCGTTVINPANQSLADVRRTYRSMSKQITTITMCGNIGDSMGNKDIALICRWFIMRNPDILINVHTNGGLGSPETYTELAQLGVRVIFAIDGLKDTNHYHRVGVKWENIERNLSAYQSGFENKIKVRWTSEYNDDDDCGEYGMAEIQMILWRHNQHQILDMADFAQKYKADLWFRRPAITPTPECDGGMPVFTTKGAWLCNLHEPEDMFAQLSSHRFSCPHQWFEGNNLRDWVSREMDNISTSKGINIHHWKRVIKKPIPIDQTHKPNNIDDWVDHVPIRWAEPVKADKYPVSFNNEQIERFSTSVACKSFNFNKPADINNNTAERELFVSAEGFVSPCCMMGSALSMHLQNAYDVLDQSEVNVIKKDFVNRVIEIGIDKFDTSKHTLEEIIESKVLDRLVFDNITDNNARKGRLPFCSSHCGTFNSIGRPSKDDRDNG
jgi:hypothetical protein